MTALVFVDTNVLVYARDPRDPAKHAAARAWMESLWHERNGRLSTQVLNEFYQTATRKLQPAMDPQLAWSDVQLLLTWKPQSLDAQLLGEARAVDSRYRLGWWDALIVAAAARQSCSVLLSEDLQDGMAFGSVRVLNPCRHDVREPAAWYAAQPRPRPVHRGRGRPRKVAAA
jgi:predicted nucleic acid-binding protein